MARHIAFLPMQQHNPQPQRRILEPPSTNGESQPEPEFLYSTSLHALVLNALATLPYNSPIPGAQGVCTGDLVATLKQLAPHDDTGLLLNDLVDVTDI